MFIDNNRVVLQRGTCKAATGKRLGTLDKISSAGTLVREGRNRSISTTDDVGKLL